MRQTLSLGGNTMERVCKICKKKYDPEEDGRGDEVDCGFCFDCDLEELERLDNEQL